MIRVVRICTSCNTRKDIKEFHKRASWCKDCKRAWRKEYDARPERKARKAELHREYKLRKTYGITSSEYDKMYEEQQGYCAICKEESPDKKLAVDHDHETGEVRMLLCANCNLMVGHAREKVVNLESAILYLRSFK